MRVEDAWQKTKGEDFLREERQLSHPIRKMILNMGVGGSVLDVGCASAIDYPLWMERGFVYRGLDVTPKFIKRARELYPGILLTEGDASRMPFPDRSISSVYCKDLLEHIPPEKYKSVIMEMWRVASSRMMIALYLAPASVPEQIRMEQGHYFNRYNKDGFVAFLKGLPRFGSLKIIEGIGYNNSALYIIDKV